jgi:formate dehydrogenase (coenzyme F420) alpha subunit
VLPTGDAASLGRAIAADDEGIFSELFDVGHQLTTCTFCGVGCGIYLETAGNQVTGAYPSMSHPTNAGRICVRGWHVHEVASSPDRLKQPLLKRNGTLEEVSWDEAIHFIALKLHAIRARYGPDALAFFNSPRCSNEESYLLQKLARSLIGTNNVDHGTGVYCNNSINILLDMLGVPATTNSIGELAKSEVIVVDGVDLAMQLPTIGGWVIRAKLNGAKVIAVDARRHRVAEHADYFLHLRPGNRALIYGAMAKVILDRGLMDMKFITAHCRNYEAFLAETRAYDLMAAADVCGVPPELIEEAALAYARAKSAALLYSTGVESRGKDSIRAMVNLALLTGNLGKEGAGLFALTEQNNLQGVCDMGMLPDRLPGYSLVTEDEPRQHFERQWKASLPKQPGLGARAVLENPGPIHGLWLCRYDPVTTASFCNAAEILKKLDLVVVQHLFMTGTAQYADVILPLVAFGEEEVSFTSTDRRIQLAEKVIEPPTGPLPAWQQLTRIAQAMGADWNYHSSAEVMDEIGQTVPLYGGAHFDNLRRDYGRQWPCTKDKPLGTRFLFEEGIPDHPFKFVPVPRPTVISSATPDYPMALIFGHSLYYWHQNVLVQHSETLKRELRVLLLDYPEGFVEINDEDAKQLGLRDGAKIRLVSPNGTSGTTARVTHEVRSGAIFVPFFVREVERQIFRQVPPNLGTFGKPVYVRVEKG